jgi:hypothetical protein
MSDTICLRTTGVQGTESAEGDTQRHMPHIPSDEEQLRTRIVELATRYGRYGYRRIKAMLRQESWQVNLLLGTDLETRRT